MAIIGNAYIVVHAITTGFRDDVNRQMNGITRRFEADGDRAGRSFARGLRSGTDGLTGFQREALAANDAFFRMVTTGYALGPAISVAIGAISNLVSGLFALVSQIGTAVPSLFALVGAFAAVAQAALAAKLAFGGIGAAYKQLTKGGAGAAGSARQVENAERNLARVLEQNREALTRANERLTEAEKRLTEARKEAAEWLQQLNFDAEDAALAEQRAVLALEDARLTLMRVQDLPPNSRARIEAELAYAEADLNLRRAIDRNQDLAAETEEANAKGVEGSKQVVDATRAVQDAIDDKARTERDALRALIDAQNALNDARRGGGGGGGDDSLTKLSKEAQEFVKYLVSIKDKLQLLRNAAGKFLFPQLTVALDKIVNKLFPAFVPVLEATGKALGEAAVDFANVVTEANNLEKFERVGKNNAYVISNLGKVTGNLYDAFLSLMDAADPLIRRFTDWLVVLTDGWKESLNTKNATGELTDMFNKAGDAAAQIGSILGNIWDGLMNLGRAASGPGSGGQKLMDTFETATEKFVEFTDRILKDGSAEEFFNKVADNFTSIMGLLKDITSGFLKLGDEKGIGETAEKLREAGPYIRDMIEKLIGGAPALADAIKGLVEFLNIFTENESIKAFFGTLKIALGILNSVFGSAAGMAILNFVAPIFGVVKAFTLMNKVGKFAGKVLLGYGVKADVAGEKTTGLFGKFAKNGPIVAKLQTAFTALTGPVGLAVLAIAAVVAILVVIYKKSEAFRKALKELVDLLWGRLKEAFETIKGAIDKVMEKFGGTENVVNKLNDAFKAIGDFLAKYIVPIIGKVLVTQIDILTGAIEGLIYFIGFIAKAFEATWHIVAGITALLRGDITGMKEHFGKAVGAIGDAFIFLKDTIVAVFRTAFNFIADVWNNTVGQLSFTIPDWIPDAFGGGKTFSVPKISKWSGGAESTSISTGGSSIQRMASGAIVNQPTMALIGEAGREAVIPLTRPLRALQLMNSSGLTGLARAASVASSNAQGQPIVMNIYPSPGMDETELAAVVSRQLAFQLRKGTV